MTVHRIAITKARIHLGSLAKRAHNHQEYFILEKDGIPVIGIMAADELEDYLETLTPSTKDKIRKSNEDIKQGKTRAALNFIEELENKDKVSRKDKKILA